MLIQDLLFKKMRKNEPWISTKSIEHLKIGPNDIKQILVKCK